MKQLIIKLIDIFVKIWLRIKDTFWRVRDFFYRKVTKAPQVASVDDTIDEIVKNKRSIAATEKSSLRPAKTYRFRLIQKRYGIKCVRSCQAMLTD